MTVYCNPAFSQGIREKHPIVVQLMSGMIFHFQNLDFGSGVKEVVYNAISGDSVFLLSFMPGISYSTRYKVIGSLFYLDYEKIESLNGESLLTFISQHLIEETRRFEEKKIRNFDLNGFVASLETYFTEAINLVLQGKSPSEGKVLNEDIKMAMLKKFSKL